MIERVSGVRGRHRATKSARGSNAGKSAGLPRNSRPRSGSMPDVGSLLMPSRRNLEGAEASGEGFADAAHAQDADGLALDPDSLRLAPDTGFEVFPGLGVASGEGEH